MFTLFAQNNLPHAHINTPTQILKVQCFIQCGQCKLLITQAEMSKEALTDGS